MNNPSQRRRRTASLAAAALLALAPLGASAQQAVYRCDQGGKIGYSHEPCLGGKVIDATPTQGMDKMSGVSRKGPTFSATSTASSWTTPCARSRVCRLSG